MSDDDDYLSDKFLVEEPKSSKPTTYSQLRKAALKQSQLKNERNQRKSRRELELEAREEGLNTSLFERAKRDEEAGLSHQNKALSIMMKMGFKPGQSLGNADQEEERSTAAGAAEGTATASPASREDTPPVATGAAGLESRPLLANEAESSRSGLSPSQERATHINPNRSSVLPSSSFSLLLSPSSGASAPQPLASSSSSRKHRAEPIPLVEWGGRKGIGLGKRARSPGVAERMAKMAKMEQDADQRDFRSRTRDEYNNRQAQGRLGPAQRTCTTLDEQKGKSFNVLWLNPDNPNTFPPGFVDALALHNSGVVTASDTGSQSQLLLPDSSGHQGDSIEIRLKRQMQADALRRPFSKIGGDYDDDGDDDHGLGTTKSNLVKEDLSYPPDVLEEAAQFLRLQALDRLHLVLSYLREEHAYCFWCGVQYTDAEDIAKQCPGPNEDDHD